MAKTVRLSIYVCVCVCKSENIWLPLLLSTLFHFIRCLTEPEAHSIFGYQPNMQAPVVLCPLHPSSARLTKMHNYTCPLHGCWYPKSGSLTSLPQEQVFYCQQGQIFTCSSLRTHTPSLFQNAVYHITKASADTLEKEPHKGINARL